MSPARRSIDRYPNVAPSTGRWRGTRDDPRLTRHACERMREMGLGLDRVREILLDPDVEYGNGEGARPFTAQRGRLAVGFADDPETGIVVLTVLYRKDHYVRAR